MYALARLADDWAEERQICIDVLCAYLRMPYQPIKDPVERVGVESVAPAPVVAPMDNGESAQGWEARRQERLVRQTVLRIIAAHLRPQAQLSLLRRRHDHRRHHRLRRCHLFRR
jgi:hypothetical protein